MSEARLSMYPFETHCRSASEAPRSVPILRSAMLTTVPSSIATPDPRVTDARVVRPRVERSVRSRSSGSSGGSGSARSGGTLDLAPQLLGCVRGGSLLGQPVVDLLALGVAHQA